MPASQPASPQGQRARSPTPVPGATLLLQPNDFVPFENYSLTFVVPIGAATVRERSLA